MNKTDNFRQQETRENRKKITDKEGERKIPSSLYFWSYDPPLIP